ncbi:bifunctional phosphopantothenoylcysteine decarboxylase/phosphopantothenate--cysteine ligase CoaBC [Nitrococcus mobilis]|uniref:Coenzyme A biosynthesis bifunctional protein CoaBC n=1 Tax=Nitrococcus mobilis Nb-231 TaxID=314278 RepID=A4BU24_9GAMM|nr:bifunctional phosphopantothenoylcysteine decarboxylase/phosphopantothenate--cysteine ligase CoaBC [Nitrococcus mobilis]EAR20845.1 DNA/pantothenate metabolism flavoprotein [Nitrococcus mobilis Nb-231]
MPALTARHILLGVTGGIAAYKSPDLARRLREAGAEVRIAMTRAAKEFVRPLTFQAVSGKPVHCDLLDPAAEAAMGHIELARWAELVLVAPASANFMARLAHGHADDLLTTLCLATRARIVLAPAMNQAMWAHAATQANRAQLEARGVRLLGPDWGDQACGEVGPGRMLEPAAIVAGLSELYSPGALQGCTVMITAGPTREAIDPVRFISNRSSGKMGFELAAAAQKTGARVIVIAGPSGEFLAAGIERWDVETAQQMYETVMQHIEDCDIFIGAAAVADYRPATRSAEKIKKKETALTLRLVRNPDIVQAVAALDQGRPFTVGFAAETHRLKEHAEHKRCHKQLDMIAANWVGRPGLGFDSTSNALEVFWEGGHVSIAQATKAQVARHLIEIISERYHAQSSAAHSGS